MDNAQKQLQEQQYRQAVSQSNGSPSDSVVHPTPEQSQSLETLESDQQSQGQGVVVVYKKPAWRRWLLAVGIVLLIIILATFAFVTVSRRSHLSAVRSGTFKNVHLPLSNILSKGLETIDSPAVTINGQLTVSDSIIIQQTLEPEKPKQGQLYYDKKANELRFYNGEDFINLGASVQTSTNVTNVINAGTGTSTTTGTGEGSVTSSGGRAGAIAKFTSDQTLGPSIITDNGSAVAISGNLNLASPSATSQPDLRIWADNPTPTNVNSTDLQAVEVGVKIRSDVSGFIKGVRFYKGPTNTGTHTGHLWTSNGTLLASVTFTGETASGWQEATFSTPVAIASETTYVVSYHTDVGRYAFDQGYFTPSGHSNSVLHALRAGEDGAQGVFTYSASPALPVNGFHDTNYWVDAIFQPNPPPSQYQINSVQISSSDLSNNSDIAKRGASQIFTGNNTFRTSAGSANAVSIQNPGGDSLLQADTLNDRLYVGTPGGSAAGIILVLPNRTSGGDPVGVDGAIYYNQQHHIFRCYRRSMWGACPNLEVENNFSVYDEFMGGQVSDFSVNNIIGSLGWNAQAIGANGGISFNPGTPTPIADRPGVLVLQTPAVINQGTTLMLGTPGFPSMILQANNVFKTGAAVGSATNQVLRIGLHTETTAITQPLSGVWWEANPAAGTKWRYCYGDGTTATCTNSTVDITANTWVRLEIRVYTTGTNTTRMDFGINGVFFTKNNVTVDVTTRLSPAFSCYTTAASAQNCYWDYFQLNGGTSSER